MYKTVNILLIFFITGLVVAATSAQKVDPMDPFHTLTKEVKGIKELSIEGITVDQAKQMSSHMSTISKSLLVLKESSGNSKTDKNAGVPMKYRKSLDFNLTTLQRISDSKSKLSPEKKLELAKSVIADFAIKEAFATKNPDTPFADVNFIARTPGAVNMVSGFEIWYVSKGLEDDASSHQRFDRLSSPTTQAIPPGGYMMWSYDSTKKVSGDKRPIDVGADGKTDKTIDLPIP
jgi:hypothetical protein